MARSCHPSDCAGRKILRRVRRETVAAAGPRATSVWVMPVVIRHCCVSSSVPPGPAATEPRRGFATLRSVVATSPAIFGRSCRFGAWLRSRLGRHPRRRRPARLDADQARTADNRAQTPAFPQSTPSGSPVGGSHRPLPCGTPCRQPGRTFVSARLRGTHIAMATTASVRHRLDSTRSRCMACGRVPCSERPVAAGAIRQ
jgi:hypothetical protein